MERSGAQAGADNVARLKAYLDRLDAAGKSFPTRNGRPISAPWRSPADSTGRFSARTRPPRC